MKENFTNNNNPLAKELSNKKKQAAQENLFGRTACAANSVICRFISIPCLLNNASLLFIQTPCLIN
jgi:hypothetical protein